MKYSDLDESKRKHLGEFLREQAKTQSTNGRDSLDQATKSILIANTGGIAVTGTLISSKSAVVNLCFIKAAAVLFLLGVSVVLCYRFWLAIAIGKSVSNLKDFHRGLIDDNEDASDKAVREKLEELSKNLDGVAAIIPAGLPILMFLAGAITACSGLFV